ncbi:MAG: endolytic transglycosylase MltG [Pseudomonadota bacterium]
MSGRGALRWQLLAALLVAVLAAALALAAAERWYRTPIALAAPVVVYIAPGEPLGRVAQRLAGQGLLGWPRLYTWIARREGLATRIRAGEYEVRPGTSPAALLTQFVEGRVLLHAVTLVDGWTWATALAALHHSAALTRTVAGPADAALMERLGAAGVAPEGQFYPDTYLVPRGTSDLELLRLAHNRLTEQLSAAWQARRADLPLATPYELLILASLVEKETAAADERAHIAAVFVNRLRRGMRLQTDPTVIYGLGDAYDGHIHRRDLTTDTPYNTYTRDGLPPTPIALVGAPALLAAAQPADSGDLYFVASGRGDGRHQFSGTLEAHNAAVARYLEKRRGGGGRR